MAATQIGIVYGVASGIIRRWIVPDRDTDLKDKHPVAPGETMQIVDRATVKSSADIEAAVAKAIGRQPPSPRCAVINAKGEVIDIKMADPALDHIDGCTLVLDAEACVGWKLVSGALSAPVLDVQVVDPIAAINL